MPKITSYNLEWLSKPNPGHALFTPSPATSRFYERVGNSRDGDDDGENAGPKRTIARRGTEVFVAVGNEIRWADLAYLKDKLEKEKNGEDSQNPPNWAQGYRTLTTKATDDIQQLILSPRNDYIAILTKHTVHIGVIPEPSSLTAKDASPYKLRTYTLGPTTHVTTQSPIASAVWHPLGVSGLCLVTVTADANVRVWELSVADRWSFDRPTMSINLQKLVDGTSQDQDFSASVAGLDKRSTFSPDSFEMEVASATFASRNSGGWSPMTLWVAMKAGDVYALCPLLPEKWSPPPTLIPSLSVSIVANVAALEDDYGISAPKKQLAQQQLAWMSDIDAQEPQFVDGIDGEPEEVFLRPSKPGRVPKLQGPFDFELAPPEEDELDIMLSDIHVIGPKLEVEELTFGEDDESDTDELEQGLSVGIVCLTARNGRLSILLDVEGVEAKWLPRTKLKLLPFAEEDDDYPSLLTFQVMDTLRSDDVSPSNWPVFTPDVDSNYSFYITNTSNVLFISLTPWVFRLETELSEGAAGTNFRIDLLAKSQSSIREEVHRQKMVDASNPLSAATPIRDSDLGHFMLTSTDHGPITVVFEPPYEESDFLPDRTFNRSPTYESDTEFPLKLYEPRPIYEPAHALEIPSSVPSFLASLHHKNANFGKAQVRLSPATLTVFTDAHKLISEETHRLGQAAAELFRRIEVLQSELRSQIGKANEVAQRVEEVTGEDVQDGPLIGANERITERFNNVKSRQEVLAQRLDRVRKTVGRASQRDLSVREKAWLEEVTTTAARILPPSALPSPAAQGDDPFKSLTSSLAVSSISQQPYERYAEVQNLADDLVAQAKELSEDSASVSESGRASVMGSSTGSVLGSSSGNIAAGGRKVRVTQTMRDREIEEIKKALDRQIEIVASSQRRMERLLAAE